MLRFCRPAIILVCIGVLCLGLSAWFVAAKCRSTNAMQDYERHSVSDFLFEQRSFQFHCEDRPQPLPPGQYSQFISPGAPPYGRSRAETLNIPLSEVPALTITSEPASFIRIAGADQDFWQLQYCASGQGNSEQQATKARDSFSIARTGSLVSLNVAYPAPPGGGGISDLVAHVPRDAPLTLNIIGAVEVHNLNGPLHLSAVGGRATILNTTGPVDAEAEVVDFAGAHGRVMLNSYAEIDIKITGPRFLGGLSAYAQREVRVIVPRGFESPIEVMVENKKDLVCRADFCSSMKQRRDAGAYIFNKLASTPEAANDHVWFRSDHSTVVIDNWTTGPLHRLYH